MFGKKDKDGMNGNLSSEQVIAWMEEVRDPVLEKNLVELGMVKDAAVEADRVRLGIELPTPAWEPKEQPDPWSAEHSALCLG
jgi:metal-sulfur cluster biosynthetic enzyme